MKSPVLKITDMDKGFVSIYVSKILASSLKKLKKLSMFFTCLYTL